MRVVGTVINDKFGIEGLVLKGRMKEFGMMGTEVIEQAVYLKDLKARKFKNFQVTCGDFGVRELGNFKLRDVAMFVLTSSGIKSIDNTISLKKRLLIGGELRGFEVEIPGLNRTARYKTEDVIKLCKWLKPDNFVVRYTESKAFIAGKPGMSIENLPELELGSGDASTKKAGTSAAVDKDAVGGGTKLIGNTIDIIGLYDVIDEIGGLVVKLPRTGYRAHTTPAVETGEEFVRLDVGEVGSPRVTFAEDKLNANTNFKQIGTVPVNFHGAVQTLYTFVYKTKSIFVNGTNNMEYIGLCMKPEIIADVLDVVGDSFAVERVEDPNILGPIRAVQGDKDLVMLVADVRKIDLMSVERARKSLLNISDVYKILLDAENIKGINKYLRYIIKESKAAALSSGWEDPRPKYGLYAGYNEDALNILKEANIDVYSGAYIGVQESSKAREDEAARLRASIETGEVVYKETIEIAYSIKGYDVNKHKANTFGALDCGNYATPELTNVVNIINSKQTVVEVLDAATKMLGEFEKRLYKIRRQLWLHKMGMYLLGDGKVHQHDKQAWTPVKTRKANSEAFDCTEPDCEGLKVTLTNITM